MTEDKPMTRSDKIRSVTHLIGHGLYKAGRFMASLRIESDPLSTLEEAEQLDRIAALEAQHEYDKSPDLQALLRRAALEGEQ